MKKLNLYLVSDSSGETVLAVSKATFVQFVGIDIEEHMFLLVRTEAQVDSIIEHFNKNPGIIIFTMGHGIIRDYFLKKCKQYNIPAICPLQRVVEFVENHIKIAPLDTKPGKYKSLDEEYYAKISNINYTLAHDDGQLVSDYADADIILLGISRTSKSPTSLYLAQRGYNVANFPIIKDLPIPTFEKNDKQTIIGLTIAPAHSFKVRNARMMSFYKDKHHDNLTQQYSSIDAIKKEINYANSIFKTLDIPVIDVSNKAIEEVAAEIINLHYNKN